MKKGKSFNLVDLFVLIILIILIDNFFCNNAYSFEVDPNDRYYYEMQGRFSPMPDKLAHFCRSYGAAQFLDLKYLLPMNLCYELYDERRGVGFSYKDLFIDTIGAISGKLHGRNLMALVVWNSHEKNIILNLYVRF